MKKYSTFIAEVKKPMRSIKELRALQAASLAAHHKLHAELEDEIKAVRKAQGTKLKAPDYTGYREPGRDAEPTSGWR